MSLLAAGSGQGVGSGVAASQWGGPRSSSSGFSSWEPQLPLPTDLGSETHALGITVPERAPCNPSPPYKCTNGISYFGWATPFWWSLSTLFNSEESCREAIGGDLNLAFPRLIVGRVPPTSHRANPTACWLHALRVGWGGRALFHLIQTAFPCSGYHRLKEGAVPTIFESFSKLRRTTKTKGHSYPPGPPDVSRLRRCRKRYVLQRRGRCPTAPQV